MGPATRSNDSNRVSWFLCGRDQGGDLAAGSSHHKTTLSSDELEALIFQHCGSDCLTMKDVNKSDCWSNGTPA